MRRLELILSLLLALACLPMASTVAQEPEAAEKLDKLIAQLGADEYVDRQAAKLQLEQMGLKAFDALFEAQDHADIEIALAARFLVRSMKVRWAAEGDPDEVKRILNDYGNQNSENRRTLMHKLSVMPEGVGIGPLCRIIRYESDGSLAKHAALLLLEVERPSDDATSKEWAETVRKSIGDSRRSGADWALAFAKTLVAPDEAVAIWDQLIRAEHATLLTSPDKTDREIVRQLMRWQAELLLDLERRDEAVAVMQRTIGLLDKDRRQILDWIDWLVYNEAPELVPDIAAQFEDLFDEDPNLIYRLAETQLRRGLTEEANTTAKRAQQIQPQNIMVHFTMANLLKQRDLFDWAEQEYRVVIENSPEASAQSISTRAYLAEMLHDIQRDKRAGDVLKELVELAEKNPEAREALVASERSLGEIKSRMNYFYSEHAKANANVEEVMERLAKGFEADPYDVDLLIGMYRLKTDDAEWKEKTTAGLKKAIAHYRDQITTFEKQAANFGNFPRQTTKYEWAMACNQYAWLVSNTEGDFQDAIKQSHQSLKLRPDSASFLDTLGRCYFAAGNLEKAIEYQKQAVELEPHMGQIRRQLEYFEAELAKRNSVKEEDGTREE